MAGKEEKEAAVKEAVNEAAVAEDGLTVETKEADTDNVLTMDAPFDDDLLEDSEKAILDEKPPEEEKVEVEEEVKEQPAAEVEAEPEEKAEEPKADQIAEPVKQEEEPPPLFAEIQDATTLLEFKPKYDAARIKSDLEEVEKQYAAGDMDDADYKKKAAFLDKLLLEDEIRKETVDAHNKAVVASEESRWIAAQQRFFNKKENRHLFEDDDINAAFCNVVKRISTQYRGESHATLLEAAKEAYEKKFGVVQGGKAEAKAEKKEEKTPVEAPPQGKKPVIPVTVGGVPPVQREGMGSKFSYLTGLKGEDLEEAVDNMKPEVFNEYMRTRGH